MKINSKLSAPIKEKMVEFLKKNAYLFAWKPEDMPGVNPNVIMHELNLAYMKKSIQYHKRRFAREKSDIIKKKVNFLKKVGWGREVDYPIWFSNVVLANKVGGEHQMCVDFTDVNTMTPNDCFPFPSIEQLVDATLGLGVMSFMDVSSCYDQIWMHPRGEEKMAFITEEGTYCYSRCDLG